MAIEQNYTSQGGVWNNNTRRWTWQDEHSQLHRADGPSVLYPDGAQWWYQHSYLHRVDGPAVIRADGSQYWCQHGELHRIDGPAVIRADGRQGWHVQGQEITAEVLVWMRDNAITWPFTESQQMEFALRWL
jgi:hypothetical protein